MDQELEKKPEQQEPEKSAWQTTKECWYDKIPLTLKQLDIIVGICWTLLILTFAAILLDAFGVF
ncbi:MAG: hypothetical protein ACI3VZ_02670 [Faecousia sp.]